MKTALVHDWLAAPGGAESVLEAIHERYPGPIHTLVCDRAYWEGRLSGSDIRTSFLQALPGAARGYRKYLPLFPMAIESFDLSDYDVVISSSHAVAKGVLTRYDQLHVCYCHTPMRYAWNQTHAYLGSVRPPFRWLARLGLHYVRLWDLGACPRVDAFIANSAHTARQIARFYQRQATVIYPPVDIQSFPLETRKSDYFVIVSRLVPYKRVDLVVEAFNRLRLPLRVIGSGPERERIARLAGPTVELLGSVGSEALRLQVMRARAFVYAAEEDFGIAPVEAQAAGTPVIAFARGGLSETVVDGQTGVLFHEQTPAALEAAVRTFLRSEAAWDAAAIRRNAERFGRERFLREFSAFVEARRAEFAGRRGAAGSSRGRSVDPVPAESRPPLR